MRLCGGEALMAISADALDLDMEKVSKKFEEMGCRIKGSDDLMIVAEWNGLETTVYSQGKVMFFPLKDRTLCIKYASELLRELL